MAPALGAGRAGTILCGNGAGLLRRSVQPKAQHIIIIGAVQSSPKNIGASICQHGCPNRGCQVSPRRALTMFSSSCPCAGSFIVECQIGNAASQAKTVGQCAPRCACGKINEVRWFTTTDEHETCLKSSFHRFAHRSVGAHRADSNASKPNIDCVVGQHESRIPGVKSTRFSSQCVKKRPRVFHRGCLVFGVLTGRLARHHNLRGR